MSKGVLAEQQAPVAHAQKENYAVASKVWRNDWIERFAASIGKSDKAAADNFITDVSTTRRRHLVAVAAGSPRHTFRHPSYRLTTFLSTVRQRLTACRCSDDRKVRFGGCLSVSGLGASVKFGTSVNTQQWAQPVTAGLGCMALAAWNVKWRLWNELGLCVYGVPITCCSWKKRIGYISKDCRLRGSRTKGQSDKRPTDRRHRWR